jgi:hypothetical protein
MKRADDGACDARAAGCGWRGAEPPHPCGAGGSRCSAMRSCSIRRASVGLQMLVVHMAEIYGQFPETPSRPAVDAGASEERRMTETEVYEAVCTMFEPTFPVKGRVRFVVDDELVHPLSYRCEGEDMTYYAQPATALVLLDALTKALAKSDCA